MKYTKYLLVCLGIIGGLIFLIAKNSLLLGLCSDVTRLPGGYEYCRSFAAQADYFWPLWDFSRAALLVGVMVLIHPILTRRLLILTGVSAVIITLAVLAAPSISSDFILPLEKKIVGSNLSVLYLFIAAVIFGWELFRKKE
jgi:hypothetical protein